MKKAQALVVIIIFLILITIAGYFVLNSGKGVNEEKNVGEQANEKLNVLSETETIREETQTETKKNFIEITSSGFSPNSLTISQGEEVIFINKVSSVSWPASAVHPTHKVYPGSDINKCNTAEENKIFDACRGLKQGESYSFTFNEKGNWKYHDHLNSKLWGEIIVE